MLVFAYMTDDELIAAYNRATMELQCANFQPGQLDQLLQEIRQLQMEAYDRLPEPLRLFAQNSTINSIGLLEWLHLVGDVEPLLIRLQSVEFRQHLGEQ